MPFQRPASRLQIPHVLCTSSYLVLSGGNRKVNNYNCHQEESTRGNTALSGEGQDTAAGNSALSLAPGFGPRTVIELKSTSPKFCTTWAKDQGLFNQSKKPEQY